MSDNVFLHYTNVTGAMLPVGGDDTESALNVVVKGASGNITLTGNVSGLASDTAVNNVTAAIQALPNLTQQINGTVATDVNISTLATHAKQDAQLTAINLTTAAINTAANHTQPVSVLNGNLTASIKPSTILNSQVLVANATSQLSSVVGNATNKVMITGNASLWVNIGVNGTAAAASGSTLLTVQAQGSLFGVTAGATNIAVLADSGTATACITEFD